VKITSEIEHDQNIQKGDRMTVLVSENSNVNMCFFTGNSGHSGSY